MNQTTTYTFADGLVQAIANNLNAQPASQSRVLLNAIEAECSKQDEARAQTQRDAERKAIEDELKAKLQSAITDNMQTPASDPSPIAS